MQISTSVGVVQYIRISLGSISKQPKLGHVRSQDGRAAGGASPGVFSAKSRWMRRAVLCLEAYRRRNDIFSPSSASNRDGDDREGRRAPTLHKHKENGSRPWPSIACLKILPLDRTRSRSLPPCTKRRYTRCAWEIDPIPRPRSLQKRSSSWHNEVSAIRSGCASARFDLCRNRSPTQKLNAYRLPGWTSEREAA